MPFLPKKQIQRLSIYSTGGKHKLELSSFYNALTLGKDILTQKLVEAEICCVQTICRVVEALVQRGSSGQGHLVKCE